MLVLSRKINESIIVNDNIVITILRVEGNKVRIGIDAPGNVPILRQELSPFNGPATAEAERPAGQAVRS